MIFSFCFSGRPDVELIRFDNFKSKSLKVHGHEIFLATSIKFFGIGRLVLYKRVAGARNVCIGPLKKGLGSLFIYSIYAEILYVYVYTISSQKVNISLEPKGM